MNKQLKLLTRTIFGLFIVLFASVTTIQIVQADDLRSNPLNQRTTMNALRVERGPILVEGYPVAQSVPSGDEFSFLRTYPDPYAYAPATGFFSNYQGMTEVEAAMNKELSGTGDTQFFTRFMRIITGQKPQGSAVELTLDIEAQQAALEAMSGYQGAVIAYDPTDGRILAFVSTPSFDPNLLSSNNDLEIIENYRALNQDPDKPLLNRIIGGDLYHPGSTYKLITAAAALESGAATSATEFKNDVTFQLPQSSAVIENFGGTACGPDSTVTLETAVAYSCNVPIAELATKMDIDTIPKMAEAFGFGQDLSIPMPVTPSISPIPMSKAEAAISSIGQLDVRATPLQMAMVSAAIGNGGVIMKPQIIKDVIAPNLNIEKSFEPEVFATPISKSTATQLKNMMIKSVNDPSGAAAMAAIPGIEVAGKTGTAENGLNAFGEALPYTIWFTGFAPAQNPKVAIAVVVESGGGEMHDFVGTSYEIPTSIGKQVMEAVLFQ